MSARLISRTTAVLGALLLLALVLGTIVGARYALAQAPTGPAVCGAHGGASLCYTHAS